MSKRVHWRLPQRFLLASILALLALMAFSGFATRAGATALQQPYAPAGATGTGVNAPPKGSEPLVPGLWDAKNYRIPHHVASCPQPPNTAAARLALANSPAMLQYYGLPLLSQVGDLALWQKIVTHN